MKIAIVGAGAMGSLFGGLLAETDSAVWLLDIWADHMRAAAEKGLEIERDGCVRKVEVHATTDPNEIPGVDLAVIFVKSTHTEAAAQTTARLIGDHGHVMTLQNGLGNADRIAQYVDPIRVIAGTTSHGATLLGPGRIRHAGAGPTVIGIWKMGDPRRAERVADCFSKAGIETTAVEDVRSVIWAKLLVNVGINAITALTGIKNGQLLDLDATRELSRAAVEEALAVAKAQNIDVRADALEHVFQVAAATAENRSSMGQDVDGHRQTEIESINGVIVREAERLRLQAPVNKTLTALIQTLQAHY